MKIEVIATEEKIMATHKVLFIKQRTNNFRQVVKNMRIRAILLTLVFGICGVGLIFLRESLGYSFIYASLIGAVFFTGIFITNKMSAFAWLFTKGIIKKEVNQFMNNNSEQARIYDFQETRIGVSLRGTNTEVSLDQISRIEAYEFADVYFAGDEVRIVIYRNFDSNDSQRYEDYRKQLLSNYDIKLSSF